jgi:hypothetical protein
MSIGIHTSGSGIKAGLCNAIDEFRKEHNALVLKPRKGFDFLWI